MNEVLLCRPNRLRNHSSNFPHSGVPCAIRGGGPPPTKVHVFDFPFEGSDQTIVDALRDFGAIKGIRRQKYIMSILDLPLSSAETSMLFLTGLRIIVALLLLPFLAILLGLFSLFSESAVWWSFGATYNPTTPLSRIDLVGCPLPWLHHVRLVISSLVLIVTMRLSSWYAPCR